MYTGYSSVTTSDIPVSAPVVFAYADGEWSQVEQVKRHCPHARIVTIACLLTTRAAMYDFEPGCIPVSVAPTHLLTRLASGQQMPIAYASLDDLEMIRDDFVKAGGNLDDVRWLPAHFTSAPELPEWAAGVQWSQTALGRNLNEYLLRSDFFGPVKPPVKREKEVVLTVDLDTGKVTVKDEIVAVNPLDKGGRP